jgi:hypothetical protein
VVEGDWAVVRSDQIQLGEDHEHYSQT